MTPIKQMEKDYAIEDHTGSAAWILNPVLVTRPDVSLYIVVNLRQVNKAIKNTHLPIPHVNDILSMFAKKIIVSKLDLRTAWYN